MILEIFLLGLLVFILGPVLYLVWNIVLLCLGRHPIQNPHYIKPEIGKLSKSIVDQIPLVLYIPPPPETDDSKEKNRSPITVPSSVYHYPPKPAGQDQRKRRFAFLRRSKKTNGRNNGDNSSEKGKGKEHGDIKTWEDHWVSGEYPFVRLEGNRAACAICLMDFEEPEKADAEKSAKVDGAAVAGGGGDCGGAGVGAGAGDVQEVQVDEVTAEDHERLKLEDAGEGAQPLRLLGCSKLQDSILSITSI
ncbi:hypothetical protein PHLCEN_2v9675 [Hermanssonia centrifuga]|uniref:Uncharacterized protein n=1 Tax=Hermanssonia centrifuga TaxID=98765 RepID=A0A2R6NQ05_9APHY|nr:hypothetical protein PHLCEN_2v9675 [Hermanssonia centrifuga]